MIPLSSVWMVEVVVPKEARDTVDDVLALKFSAVSAFVNETTGHWTVSGISAEKPNREALETSLAQAIAPFKIDMPKVQFFELSSRDWVDENQANFPRSKWDGFSCAGRITTGRCPTGPSGLKSTQPRPSARESTRRRGDVCWPCRT